jgi:hypothetical protein
VVQFADRDEVRDLVRSSVGCRFDQVLNDVAEFRARVFSDELFDSFPFPRLELCL